MKEYGIIETDQKQMRVEDGKQEIYLEQPYPKNSIDHRDTPPSSFETINRIWRDVLLDHVKLTIALSIRSTSSAHY